MLEYQILTGASARDLEGYVQHAVKEGWVPTGGINGVSNPVSRSCVDFQQAMIRGTADE